MWETGKQGIYERERTKAQRRKGGVKRVIVGGRGNTNILGSLYYWK